MSKNIHEQIIAGKVEVEHQGVKIMFDLPEWLKTLGGTLQDKEGFLAVLEKEKLTLPFLHAGLTACLVQFRAKVRPPKIAKVEQPLTIARQKEATAYKPELQNVPKTKGTTEEQAKVKLATTHGVSIEAIEALMATLAQK